MEGKQNGGFEDDGGGSSTSLPGGGKPGGGGGVLGAIAGWRDLLDSWTGAHPKVVRGTWVVVVAVLYHAYFFYCLGR